MDKHSLSQATSRRSLLVDDDSGNQKGVDALPVKDGHSVAFASDGAQAIDAMCFRAFDIVFLDLQMPALDGIAATRAIRQLHDGPPRNVPIIALTESTMRKDVERYRDAGINYHLSKPVDRHLLRLAICRWAAPGCALADLVFAEPPRETTIASEGRGRLDNARLLRLFDGDVTTVTALLKRAIDSIRSDLRSMLVGITEHATKIVAGTAHKVRGTAAEVGATLLIETIAVIERRTKIERWMVTAAELGNLTNAVDELAGAIKAFLTATSCSQRPHSSTLHSRRSVRSTP